MCIIYNLNNGNRFTTYAIRAEKGSGIISLNGAAAYQRSKHDLIIICTYCDIDQNEVKKHLPKLIYFKDNNANVINKIKSKISIQKKYVCVSI